MKLTEETINYKPIERGGMLRLEATVEQTYQFLYGEPGEQKTGEIARTMCGMFNSEKEATDSLKKVKPWKKKKQLKQ